jgi:hypothetical protein
VQEVFLICTDSDAARKWLVDEGIAAKPGDEKKSA